MVRKTKPASRRDGAPTREHWAVETASDNVVHLDIAADANRERDFEIFCSLVVSHRDGGDASHALRVLVDGAHEWSRRVATDSGARDSLDLRFRRTVPIGRSLRVTAIGDVDGAAPLSLSIVADED